MPVLNNQISEIRFISVKFDVFFGCGLPEMISVKSFTNHLLTICLPFACHLLTARFEGFKRPPLTRL